MRNFAGIEGIALTVAFVLFTACQHVVAPASIQEDYSSIVDPAARWRAYDFKNYSIEQKRLCFCAFPPGFVRLVVKDNKIVEGIDLTTNQPVPQETLQYYQTIDELFAWMETMQAQNPARLEVEYEARFGYPKKIEFDQSVYIADEELWIEMQAFKKLPE
jgi:hypothetical protein